MKYYHQQIGAKLRKKRKESGLSLRDVSALTDIDFSTLSRIETGSYGLSVYRLLILAQALECEPSELLIEIKYGQ